MKKFELSEVRDNQILTSQIWWGLLFAQMCLEGMVIRSNRIYMYY